MVDQVPRSLSLPVTLSYEVPQSLAACRQLPWQTVVSKTVYEERAERRRGSLMGVNNVYEYVKHTHTQKKERNKNLHNLLSSLLLLYSLTMRDTD